MRGLPVRKRVIGRVLDRSEVMHFLFLRYYDNAARMLAGRSLDVSAHLGKQFLIGIGENRSSFGIQ